MRLASCFTAAVLALSSKSSAASTDDDDATAIKEAKMNYPINVIAQNYTDSDGVLLQGFLSTPNTTTGDANNEKVPAVVILHDSSGIDAYEKQRATMIANELGYAAFAADIFGVETDIPVNSGGWGGPFADFINSFSGNATLFTQRIVAAVEYVQTLPNVDESKVAILGYCLGGTGVVHYINVEGANDGGAAAAVSVHPSLLGAWEKPVGDIHIPSLFLTGGKDFLTGPQAMASLEDDMTNSSTVEWETNRYANIDHAFSNWYSENYNAMADERSWTSMKTFLEDKFGQNDNSVTSWESVLHIDAWRGVESDEVAAFFPAPVVGMLETYDYIFETYTQEKPVESENVTDRVYYVRPLSINFVDCGEDFSQCSIPAVVILPESLPDRLPIGEPSTFEMNRAAQIAMRYGYAALVAENTPLLYQLVKAMKFIDLDKVALEGYGDTGSQDALNIAMMGGNSAADQDDSLFNVISIFQVPEIIADVSDAASSTNKPQLLVSSGVDGDNMSDIIALESALIGMDANYEINRYSNATGNFYDSNKAETYNAYAAGRSFESMESIYRDAFGEFEIIIPDWMLELGLSELDSGASAFTVTAASSSCIFFAVAYILMF